MGYNVLVIGFGGRDHALALKYALSPHVDTVYFGQGNAGVKYTKEGRSGKIVIVPELAEKTKIVIPRVVDFCREVKLDLVDIAPENPLSSGLVNFLYKNSIPVIGPTAELAILESDRSFTKDLLSKIGVPVPEYAYFSDVEKALKYVQNIGYDVVVKANGLAAGRGANVCYSVEEARKAINRIMIEREFGDSGNKVLIEKRKDGTEFSFYVYLDGNGNYLPMRRIVQDYKLAFDLEDTEAIEKFGGNLNTGGMGAYSPHKTIDNRLIDRAIEEVVRPTVNTVYDRLGKYKGVLYFGLNLDPEGGLDVFEINVRHGDPEAEVILPALKTDMFELGMATWEGNLNKINLEWDNDYYVDVVGVEGRSRAGKGKGWNKGYPGRYGKRHKIFGLDSLDDGVQVFFAGVDEEDGELVTDGGRVLHLVSGGDKLETAVNKVYGNIGRLVFFDRHANQNCMRYRTTIGL